MITSQQLKAAIDDQRDDIEVCRAVMKPSPVRQYHQPRWLTQRLRKVYNGFPRSSDRELLRRFEHAVDPTSHWLDHWGTTKRGDRDIFVSEPYGVTGRVVVGLERECGLLGLKPWLSPNSWHYPGATIRIVIEPAEPR